MSIARISGREYVAIPVRSWTTAISNTEIASRTTRRPRRMRAEKPMVVLSRCERLTDKQREIVAENQGLAYSMRGRLGLNRYPQEVQEFVFDAMQDGLIHAAESFDASRGTKFSTHAYRLIRQAAWKAFDEMRFRMHVINSPMKMSSGCAHAEEFTPSVEPDPDKSDLWFTDAHRRSLKYGRERDRAIFVMRYVDGMSFRAIASATGLSKQRIHQIVARHRKEVQEHFAVLERASEVGQTQNHRRV